jgi:chromosome segregation ATPase
MAVKLLFAHARTLLARREDLINVITAELCTNTDQAVRASLISYRAQLECMPHVKDRELTEAKKHCDELKKDIENMKVELAVARDQAKTGAHDDAVKEAKRIADAFNNEVLARMNSDARRSHAEAECTKLKNELTEAKNEITRLDDLEAERARLKELLDTAECRAYNAEAECANLKVESAEYKDSYKRMNERRKEAEAECAKLKAESAELREENATIRFEFEHRASDLAKTNHELLARTETEWAKEVALLKNQLIDARARLAKVAAAFGTIGAD